MTKDCCFYARIVKLVVFCSRFLTKYSGRQHHGHNYDLVVYKEQDTITIISLFNAGQSWLGYVINLQAFYNKISPLCTVNVIPGDLCL